MGVATARPAVAPLRLYRGGRLYGRRIPTDAHLHPRVGAYARRVETAQQAQRRGLWAQQRRRQTQQRSFRIPVVLLMSAAQERVHVLVEALGTPPSPGTERGEARHVVLIVGVVRPTPAATARDP